MAKPLAAFCEDVGMKNSGDEKGAGIHDVGHYGSCYHKASEAANGSFDGRIVPGSARRIVVLKRSVIRLLCDDQKGSEKLWKEDGEHGEFVFIDQ